MQKSLALDAPAWSALHAWVEAERGRFLPWLPVGMAAGAAGYFALSWEPPAWAGLVALAVCIAAALTAGGTLVPRALCWMGAAVALGVASGQVATALAPTVSVIPTHAVMVSGVVAAVEQLPQGRRITVDHPRLNEDAPLARAVRLRLRADDPLPVAAGDALRVRALLTRPAPPAYPGGWDLQRDAYFDGMGAYGFALNPATRLAAGPVPRLQTLREGIGGRIDAVLPPAQAAIATTLLTGLGTAITPTDRGAFRDSGLAHLLAIAGLHIGIVMAVVFAVVRLLLALWEWAALRWPTKAIAAMAALAAGGGYMLLTGAHVPIIRSFAMACLVTLGVSVGRRALSLRGLALAMAALVMIDPEAVVGVSFQMSFSAVLALVAGYAALRPRLARLYGDGAWRRRLAAWVVGLGLTSALAGTASAPFAAYHFGHIQLYYVVANMLAVPMTAFWVMPAGLVALALMPLHLEALALVPMGWGIAGLRWIAQEVAAWPGAVVAVPHMPDWGLVAVSLGLAWLGLWRTRLRLLGVAAILAGVVSPLFGHPPDMLVSADARLIALRTPAGVFVQQGSGASRFTRDAWLQYWAVPEAAPLPAAGAAADGAITCTADSCLWRQVRLLRDVGDDSCAAVLLVSAAPIRRDCPGGVPKIDRFTVWRDGAQAVWLEPGGVRIVSDRDARGERPWVPPSPAQDRLPAGLTPALAETLPPE